MALRGFHDWIAARPERLRATWLILGKGPSFAELPALDTHGMLRLGLNHVVRETRVDLFHCIDIEVVAHCGEAIFDHAGAAVLPWVPHVKRRLLPFSRYAEFLPSDRTLDDYLTDYPVLGRLADQDRLLWYNLHTAPRHLRRPDAPVIPARGFSASAAVALLASAGVHRLRTLGVDGGRRYAGTFGDLNDKTLLAAGQQSFDSQFLAIAGLIRKHRLDCGPLDVPLPARVRIAGDQTLSVPARVLANRLRRLASLNLEIVHLGSEPDTPPLTTPHLELSAACRYDQDLREAWRATVKQHAEHPTGSVSARLEPQMRSHCWAADGPQPWLHTNALGGREWCRGLLDALEDGELTRADLERAIAAGQLRPSLLDQVDRGQYDPLLLTKQQWTADAFTGTGADPLVQRRLHSRSVALAARVADKMAWPRWRRFLGLLADKAGKVIAGLDVRST